MTHGIRHYRSQKLLDFACAFAEKAHGDQRRKYTNELYIAHPIEVAQLVAQVTDDCEVICAAFLHDVLEDTSVTFEQIRDAGFGYPIATLVKEVTDVSTPVDGNRKQRKGLDRLHLSIASPRGKTIKLADLISNSASILEYDPKFAKVYMEEKRLLLEVLREGDSVLYTRATQIVRTYFESKGE